MRRIPTHGKNILIKYLLDMNQRTLARAIAPVLEGRKNDGIVGFHIYGTTNSREHQPVTLGSTRWQ